MLNLILEGIVIIMLGVTIVYAIRLNSKLGLIKSQKQDFAINIKAFNDATETAIIAVEELHVKGEAVCRLIDEKIKKAELMNDEIEFLIDRANKRLAILKNEERSLEARDGISSIRPTAASTTPAQEVKKPQVNSISEAQLLKALRDREYREALSAAPASTARHI